MFTHSNQVFKGLNMLNLCEVQMKENQKKLLSKFGQLFLIVIFLVALMMLFFFIYTPPQRIFYNGGSVADVAVATIICEGIANSQSSGLGGGFIMTIYINKTRTVETLTAREVAPRLSTSTMFQDDPESSKRGGKAVAVPGELKGLWELHQKYGKLSWRKLIEPNILLARNGHVVSKYLENVLTSMEQEIYAEPSLKEIFIDPKTNRTFKLNDVIKRPKLAKTLEIIANEGDKALYGRRPLGKSLIEDIKARGGIMTEEDLVDYRVRWDSPVQSILKGGDILYTTPLPSCGPILVLMMNILKDYRIRDESLSYHRIVETFKFAFARRTWLGDEDSVEIREIVRNLTSASYANEIRNLIRDNGTSEDFEYYGAKFSDQRDQGTAHISILAPNGDAISVTSSINDKFGALWQSESTGIIMNNQMDDFSKPGVVDSNGFPSSPANFIKPNKRPLSSMTPSIVVNQEGIVRLIIGGAGGLKIPTGVAFTIMKHLMMNETLSNSIAARRIHHQLAPMELQYESGFDAEMVESLASIFGHKVVETKPDGGFAAVVGIAITEDEDPQGVVDPRRGGSVEFY